MAQAVATIRLAISRAEPYSTPMSLSPRTAPRPLVICDCDEVILDFIAPFSAWADTEKGIESDINVHIFPKNMRYRATGKAVDAEAWDLLADFFNTQMPMQTLIAGAKQSLLALGELADVVILTNLTDEYNAARVEQLKGHGLHYPVVTNQGGKGAPVQRLVAQYQPSLTIFVDDLPHHHESVAEHAPEVFRVHMVGNAALAAQVPKAPHAHVRIDDWQEAHHWISSKIQENRHGH
jgi:hypothetical protein